MFFHSISLVTSAPRLSRWRRFAVTAFKALRFQSLGLVQGNELGPWMQGAFLELDPTPAPTRPRSTERATCLAAAVAYLVKPEAENSGYYPADFPSQQIRGCRKYSIRRLGCLECLRQFGTLL